MDTDSLFHNHWDYDVRMATELLMDNWTFQNAGELLEHGLTGGEMPALGFTDDGQATYPSTAAGDLIRVQSLFQVLNGVVLAEKCVVDSDSVSSWESKPHLAALRSNLLVATKPFSEIRDEWIPTRESFEAELCEACPDLETKHRANVAGFNPVSKSSPDPHLAALLWGGAGMLARAWYARFPYVPHQLREQLFRRANVLSRLPSAHRDFTAFVDQERMTVFERADATGYFAQLRLPPVALEVIEQASTPGDLIRVAIQLRANYSKLRMWLIELQHAFEAENIEEVASRKRTLEDVAKGIREDGRTLSPASTNLELGIGAPKLKVTLPLTTDRMKNRFGVRAQMSRLISGKPGMNGIRKLAGIFGASSRPHAAALEHAVLFLDDNAVS